MLSRQYCSYSPRFISSSWINSVGRWLNRRFTWHLLCVITLLGHILTPWEKPWCLNIWISGCWALTAGYGTISCQAVLAALWLWMRGLQAYQDESQAEQAACSPSVFPFLIDCRITERGPGARQLVGGCSRLPALGVSPCLSCCLALSMRGLEVWLSVYCSLLCSETNRYRYFNLSFSLDRGQAEDVSWWTSSISLVFSEEQ